MKHRASPPPIIPHSSAPIQQNYNQNYNHNNQQSNSSFIIRYSVIAITSLILIYTFLYIFVFTEYIEESETDSFSQNDLPETMIMAEPLVLHPWERKQKTLVPPPPPSSNNLKSSTSSFNNKNNNNMSFTMLMMAVKNRNNHYYYRRSLEDKQAYAIEHGYALIAQTTSLDTERAIAWSKIKLVQNQLESMWQEEDQQQQQQQQQAQKQQEQQQWIWLVDLDTLIMNRNVTLESIADNSYDIIISEDCNNELNTGSVLFRNTAWVRNFLNKLYETNDPEIVPDVNEFWEQAAINHLYKTFRNQYDKEYRIKVVHQKTFNSFPEETSRESKCKPGRFEEGDFLVHFAGAPHKDAVFDRYYGALHSTG